MGFLEVPINELVVLDGIVIVVLNQFFEFLSGFGDGIKADNPGNFGIFRSPVNPSVAPHAPLNIFGGKAQMHHFNIIMIIFFDAEDFACAKVAQAHPLRVGLIKAKEILKLIGINSAGARKHLLLRYAQVCFATGNILDVPVKYDVFKLSLVWNATCNFNKALCRVRNRKDFIII